MSVDHTIRTLSSEVRKGMQVLERIASRLEGVSSDQAGDLEALAVTQLHEFDGYLQELLQP